MSEERGGGVGRRETGDEDGDVSSSSPTDWTSLRYTATMLSPELQPRCLGL